MSDAAAGGGAAAGAASGTVLTTPPSGGAGAGAAASGAAGDWKTSLPDDLKNEPMFANIKDIPTLAKSYVNAQRLVGADKIALPQKNWTEAQYADFFKAIGRPDAPDGYSFKVEADKLPRGFNIDDGKLKATKEFLHKSGLTDKQANDVLKYYLDSTSGEYVSALQQREAQRTQAIAELKTEFGEKYEANLDVARSVLRKFGDDKLIATLEATGMGDNPQMIRLFAKLGEALLDDTARGDGAGLVVGGAAEAQAEISKLRGDADFQRRLMNRGVGHQEAVEQWAALHKKAYPEKKP